MSRRAIAIAPISYALATGWWHIAIGEFFSGLGYAAWSSSESTYVIDVAPGELTLHILPAVEQSSASPASSAQT